MILLLNAILVLLVLSGFLLLGSGRLNHCIRIGALQGILVGLLPLVEGPALTLRIIAVGVIFMGMKGFVFPMLLTRALRDSDTSRETMPLVGYSTSLVIGMLTLMGAFYVDSLFRLPIQASSELILPTGYALIAMGLFLIVARRTAINQVIGYLVLENGIYTFGFAVAGDIPVLIELGVLMDLFVAVFVMGIAIYRINREFDHIDSDRLTSLKG